MKNISRITLENDFQIINDMLHKYNEAVYEGQCGQIDHYDNQPKLIRLAMEDVRCGLSIVKCALQMLNDANEFLIESLI